MKNLKGNCMDYTKFSTVSSLTNSASNNYDVKLRAYIISVYQYMAVALAITGLIAFYVSSSPTMMIALFTPPLSWLVLFAPLGMVFYMSARINSLTSAAAQLCFWSFACLMGLSLSSIFAVYTSISIVKTFLITSSLFGVMSIYGHTTKKDLSGIGSFLMMGLIGLVIASLVNLFLKSDAMSFIASIIGVIIFTGLTAYDTQKLKDTYYQAMHNNDTMAKVAVYGALGLYMDFVNLFIFLLRFMGNRRS